MMPQKQRLGCEILFQNGNYRIRFNNAERQAVISDEKILYKGVQVEQ